MTEAAIIKTAEETGGPRAVVVPAPRSAEIATIRDDGASLMAVIGRMAENPAVDVVKLEKLMDLYERTAARNAKSAYSAALAAMQPDLPVIERRGKIEVRAKVNGERTGAVQQSTGYALWEDINEAIKPVLGRHGFGLSFRTGLAEDGRITVTGILEHCGGHREETTMTLPHDSTGSKNAVQAVGSSTSYGKRYTASALLNLTSRDGIEKDDDGKAGGDGATISDEQVREVDRLLRETKSNLDIFLKTFGVAGIPEIKAKQLPTVLAKLEAKRAKMKEATNA